MSFPLISFPGANFLSLVRCESDVDIPLYVGNMFSLLLVNKETSLAYGRAECVAKQEIQTDTGKIKVDSNRCQQPPEKQDIR